MLKRFFSISFLFGISCLSLAFADAAEEEMETTEISIPEPFFVRSSAKELKTALVEKAFSPFTGKVKGRKVRLRTQADLDGRVVREMSSQDLLVVVGEKDNFYAVEAPAGIKAYVFRSFVLDGIVEGNRVNVRLEPSLDAPVIAHLNSGDSIKGTLSALNNKWYEIAPPAGTRFYVAKEYIESIGGPEVKAKLDKRRANAEQLLEGGTLLTQAEMQKPFREMDIERIKHNYQTVMNEFTEFPDLCDKAKEAFTALQEEYTERKIAYLEAKTEGKAVDADSSFATFGTLGNATDRMKMWEPVEESLYLSWSSRNEDRSLDEFYDEQKQDAVILSGIVEAYTSPVKRKPGDYILKNKDIPQAYLYSTQINLQDFVGKKVSVLAAPRSNNNFAFPAYFVISVE